MFFFFIGYLGTFCEVAQQKGHNRSASGKRNMLLGTYLIIVIILYTQGQADRAKAMNTITKHGDLEFNASPN